MNFRERTYQEELLDDLNVSGADLEQNLVELEVINQYLGGVPVIFDGLKKIIKRGSFKPEKPLTIVDLGCGGGDILRRIAEWGIKRKIPMELIGYDANPHVISFAEQHSSKFDNIRFRVLDVLSDDMLHVEADVILLSLFCHHFTEEENVNLLSRCVKAAQSAVLINDLHRHPLAYHSIKWMTRFFSKSSMVKNDAPLSVLRGFHRKELVSIVNSVTHGSYDIRWMWPFRYQAILWK